jgi:lipopolysaccharide assembly outer membrane protein LptD (OstA)
MTLSMSTNRSIIIAVVLALVCSAATGAESTKPLPVRLVHADELSNRTENGKAVQELYGAVHLQQGALQVTCDKAINYQDEKRLIFEGNVVFWDTVRTLTANQVVYYQETRRLTASGNVDIVQDTLEIRCQKALYLDNQEEAYFEGGVFLLDQASGSTVEGKRGVYSEPLGFSKVTGNPVFTERDTTDSVTMRIFGRDIEYHTADHLAVARDSVRVIRNDLEATGDLLEYNREEGWAVLSGTPEIRRNQEVILGDKISMFFEGGDINDVRVVGNAQATMPADSLNPDRVNWMRGKFMDLTVENGQLTQTLLRGQAQALYYPIEDGKPQGANRVSGDMLRIWIDNGEVSRIKVIGGTQGTYYPERMASRASR